VAIIKIDYRHVKEWDTEEIIDLYKAGSWWKDDYDPSGIPPLIEGSFDFVIAFDNEEKKAVGMGRSISDGVSDAYIQDVVVFPDLRGKGIGRGIVRELVDHARRSGLVWIGLIAEKDTNKFYEPLGFKTFKGTPMLLEDQEERN
jgi:ribosomal protein S18 acetylase RimI-like enzyme